jgi:hypothetical protein
MTVGTSSIRSRFKSDQGPAPGFSSCYSAPAKPEASMQPVRQERFIQAVRQQELHHTARKSSRRAALALGGMMAFAVAALAVVPRGLDAQWQLISQGDPVELADRALAQKFDPAIARTEIEKALAADDAAQFHQSNHGRGGMAHGGARAAAADAGDRCAHAGIPSQ